MNRLKNQRVYLAGPMDRCPNGGKDWREYMSPILQNYGVVVLNPANKPTTIGIEDEVNRKERKQLKLDAKYDILAQQMKTIRRVDLRMVDVSDFLIVNMDLDIYPCGTYEEIFLANRQKKPIIIHMKQGKECVPDWLFGTIPHDMMFSTWNEVIYYLEYINSYSEINTNNRWMFFDL